MKERVLVAAAVIRRGDEVLLTRRPEGKHLAGKWEFPGGKVEPYESPEEALAREIREELGIEIENLRPFRFVHHEYPGKRILMLTYLCDISREPTEPLMAWRWQPESGLDAAEMPEADRPLLEAIRAELRR